jgi:KDO2-lipid IV(A) lauroyltransferase
VKKTIRRIYYLLALFFAKMVLLLPYRAAVSLGGMLGSLAYLVIADARRIMHENLKKAFPEKSPEEIASIARQVLVNQGKNAFELFSFPKLKKADIEHLVIIENKEGFAKAFEGKKGVLILGAHCGNWEILAAALALEGFPINVIAKRIYIEGLNRMLVGFRTQKGVNVILRSEKDSARQMLRSLRNNESIGMLIDQDTSVPGVFVDFFSSPAWTPSGLATLAVRTGCSVVSAFAVREKNDHHRVVISGPFDIIRTGNNEQDVLENTRFFTLKIEEHVRRYPEQWVWMHQRWKTKQ